MKIKDLELIQEEKVMYNYYESEIVINGEEIPVRVDTKETMECDSPYRSDCVVYSYVIDNELSASQIEEFEKLLIEKLKQNCDYVTINSDNKIVKNICIR